MASNEPTTRVDLDGIEFRIAHGYYGHITTAIADLRALVEEHKALRSLVAVTEPATLDYFDGDAEPEDPTPLPAGYRLIDGDIAEEHLGKEGAVRMTSYGTPGVPTFGRIDWQYHPRTGKRRLVLVSEGYHYAKARDLYGDHVEREQWIDSRSTADFYVLDDQAE